MKIKVQDAIGPVLDWLVAKAEGLRSSVMTERDCGQSRARPLGRWCAINVTPVGHDVFSPSTNPAQGHPIIEREHIEPDWWHGSSRWRATSPENCRYDERGEYITDSECPMFGPTALIAAMRCYVASKFGDVVEVPDELCNKEV